MPTAEELVVAIKSEGASEAQDDLQGVEKQMEDTAESAGQSADDLEAFAARFQGAMKAAVAGLAVGAAGLLSQVPVVGEAFAGLRAIIDQVILKIDDDLRPSLSGLTQDLFDVAEDVGEEDSTLGALETAINGVDQAVQDASVEALQNEIEELLGITVPKNWLDLGWEAMTLDARGFVNQLTDIVSNFPDDFDTFMESLAPKAAEEWENVKTKTSNFISDLISEVKSFPSKAKSEFTDLASDLSEWASDLAEDAKEWGKSLIQKFIEGINSLIDKLSNWLDDLRDIGSDIGLDVGSIDGINVGGGGGGGGGGAPDSRGPMGSGMASGRTGTVIDGRALSESTGRYRADPGRRRGL